MGFKYKILMLGGSSVPRVSNSNNIEAKYLKYNGKK